ncbi:BMP family ABC transporter substrate-binding protein [Weissella cibaria]|uniref:BMP family lipoprotein n=1 Tax=Weissella cibaria TaxID=137591 RepID=UPI00223B64CA|nr:BMP family protein [Weissella cibaria]MCT0953174.1 BMP family ABC transporter substrate-binding protein [Weissella cibaria]
MNHKVVLGTGVVVVAAVAIGLYASANKGDAATSKASVALITDAAGIDDKSFQQSAWRGLTSWAKANDVKQGKGGYTYFQAKTSADFETNINQAVANGYQNIYGIGFPKTPAINAAAKKYPKNNFMIIDDIAKKRQNVVSVTFHTEQSSYLAGVAAAKTTKTNQLGFIGGMASAVVKTFETGFVAGAKSVNPNIKVDVQYVGDFADAGTAKTIAASMYQNGSDVLYQAAGGAGAGVFTEAKDLNEKQTKAHKVWVVGVDVDQAADGVYQVTDGKSNFTLTSATKGVGTAVKDVTERAATDKFPGGQHLVYGLKNKGVAVTRGQMSAGAWQAVQKAQKAIVAGDVKVPAK